MHFTSLPQKGLPLARVDRSLPSDPDGIGHVVHALSLGQHLDAAPTVFFIVVPGMKAVFVEFSRRDGVQRLDCLLLRLRRVQLLTQYLKCVARRGSLPAPADDKDGWSGLGIFAETGPHSVIVPAGLGETEFAADDFVKRRHPVQAERLEQLQRRTSGQLKPTPFPPDGIGLQVEGLLDDSVRRDIQKRLIVRSEPALTLLDDAALAVRGTGPG